MGYYPEMNATVTTGDRYTQDFDQLEADDLLELDHHRALELFVQTPGIDLTVDTPSSEDVAIYDLYARIGEDGLQVHAHTDATDAMDKLVKYAYVDGVEDELVALFKPRLETIMDGKKLSEEVNNSGSFDAAIESIVDEHGIKLVEECELLTATIKKEARIDGILREQWVSIMVSFAEEDMALERQGQTVDQVLVDLGSAAKNAGVQREYYRLLSDAAIKIGGEDDVSDHIEDFVPEDELDAPDNPHVIEIVQDAPDVDSELDFETRMMRLGSGESDVDDEGEAKVLGYYPTDDRVTIKLRLPDTSIGELVYEVPDDKDGDLIDLVKCSTVEDSEGRRYPLDLEQIELLSDAFVPVRKISEDGPWKVVIDYEYDFDAFMEEFNSGIEDEEDDGWSVLDRLRDIQWVNPGIFASLFGAVVTFMLGIIDPSISILAALVMSVFVFFMSEFMLDAYL